jgi:hypothetical protein
MPKKQNGFGKINSFAVKPFETKADLKVKSFGTYPRDRSFGSSVTRTVVEHQDLNSDWASWRKGYEYYAKGAWADLFVLNEETQEYEKAVVNSKLYQGTPDEVSVEFTGYKYSTQNSDTANHYVMRREVLDEIDAITITSVLNDRHKYPDQKANHEIWCQGTVGPNVNILANMIGDRLTDGTHEATLSWVLNGDAEPALYIGKTAPVEDKNLSITIDPIPDLEPKDLTDKIVFVRDFLKENLLSSDNVTSVEDGRGPDGADYFRITLDESGAAADISFYERTDDLPLSLYDLARLDEFYTTSGDYYINNQYYFQKDRYFRFFPKNFWLTGEYILERVKTVQYSIPPFEIRDVKILPDGRWELIAKSFNHTLKLLAPTETGTGYVVFADNSFIEHYTEDERHKIYTDVDPWMDEVFTSGQSLQPAVLYTCSCPSHSHAILRAPQTTEDNGTRRINRQRRYPLPTALGKNLVDGVNIGQASGLIESWEDRRYRMSYKQCKHSISSLFVDGITTIEPGDYPSGETRIKFEEKLEKEMRTVSARFEDSYKRGGITALEIIFAMAQGLNLDDVELAYLLMETKL